MRGESTVSVAAGSPVEIRFCVEGVRSLGLSAPAPGLKRKPADRIERAGAGGEGVDAVAAPRLHLDVRGIGFAQVERAGAEIPTR